MWEELEMDPAFLQRDALRKAGRPVEIARTDRLLIRETVLEDVPALYEIYEQTETGPCVRPLQPTLQEELEFMKAYIRYAYAFYDYGLWTVQERESGDVVGRAGLFPSELLTDAVELGYLIGSRWQRRGYAAECGRAILRYASETLDIPDIHLLTDAGNLPSIRTAEALGFQKKEALCHPKSVLLHFEL